MKFELTQKQKQLQEQTYQRLIRNDHVKEWLHTYQLSMEYVKDHTGKFSDWVEQVEKCDGCKGLTFCRQRVRGQFMDLYLDEFLSVGVRRCKYLKEYESELQHRRYYLAMNMSEEQLKIDVKHIDLEHEGKDYKINILHILDLLENEQPEKGLYLWGKPGVGKSYLAAGITNYYAKKKIRCAFVNVPKFISELKMLFHDRDAMDQRLRTIRNVTVLVFDDIGGESVTAWSRDEIVLPLLDARMEEKRLTFFTSNYNMAELKERLAMTSNKVSEPMAAERLLERIRTLSCEEFVKGESRRK